MDRVHFVDGAYDLERDIHIVADIPLKYPLVTQFGISGKVLREPEP
jgi:hypothetical protein